jgi:uncharacterized protein YfaS (alpha-2-macroglobulin family)
MLAVVDDALPAGFEVESIVKPVDVTGDDGDSANAGKPVKPHGPYAFLGALSDTSLQEKRDDRYVAAFNISGKAPFGVAYVVRAVTPGDFFLPGAAASDMYRPGVSAHTAAGRVNITPAR